MATRKSPSSARPAFVGFRVQADSAEGFEAALADAVAAGASGALQPTGSGAEEAASGTVYAPAAAAPAVERALAAHAPRLRCRGPEPVAEADWSERWKRGLASVTVSPRLRVRPSFVAADPVAGQAELVIDPGQAFGTGGHASTLLALEWVAALAPVLGAATRVLDVGCGTGVLALAALRLGAGRAVAFDLDPLAARATRDNARANGLGGQIDAWVGPLEALGPQPFELLLANLLRRELLPLLPGIAARTAPEGRVVLSGLLAAESPEVVRACAEVGLAPAGERQQVDPNGDAWVGLLMRPRR